MDIVGFLSGLLKKVGLKEYVQRCEFSAHIAWGLVFALLGKWFFIGWVVFCLYDEFYCDKHYKVFYGSDPEWKDLLWDLGSKTIIPILGLFV